MITTVFSTYKKAYAAKIYSGFSPLTLWFGCGGLGMLLALGFSGLEHADRRGA